MNKKLIFINLHHFDFKVVIHQFITSNKVLKAIFSYAGDQVSATVSILCFAIAEDTSKIKISVSSFF